MRILFLCTFFLWIGQANLLGQVLPQQPTGGDPGQSGGPSVSGDPLPADQVAASASDNDVPMGAEVTLTAVGTPEGKQYQWHGICDPIQFTQPVWNKASIKVCPGNSGVISWEVHYGTAKDQETITWHEPDEAELTFGGPEISVDNGTLIAWEDLKVKLSWNGEDLGPCAQVCCQERLFITAVHPAMRYFRLRNGWRHRNWIPPCGQNMWGHGRMSWDWDSPTLTDGHWFSGPYASFVDALKDIPEGTTLAKYTHYYKFTGTKCKGEEWSLNKTKTYCVVAKKVTHDGQDITVPIRQACP